MYALVDCNNFYVSCERVFNPALEGKPVIVLSNNDGCAISRSDEAKAIGIAMGTPPFTVPELIKKHDVQIFSSNYTLYGDMSDRVMKMLANFVPRLELYSIDEAFLDMTGMDILQPYKVGLEIRKAIQKNFGIPVCVGIASTKTLAKMANRYAKKNHRSVGVFFAESREQVDEMLQFTAVGDIWGIGGQYSLMLRKSGFKNAFELKNAPPEFMRKNMTVQGQRLLNELNGIPSIGWEFTPKAKKNICTSRSFAKLLTDKKIIIEAVSTHAANCARKLRAEKSCANDVEVFLNTNPHKIDQPQYKASIVVSMEISSNDTATIIKHALKGLDIIFRPGYKFMKCGVIVSNLVPENIIQSSLFLSQTPARSKKAMKAMDNINNIFGKDIVRTGVQGFERKFRLRADRLSPKYTTNINDLIKIKN